MEARQKDGTLWHEGELEVQRRAGVRAAAGEVGAIIADRIPPLFVPHVATFRMAVAATIDATLRTTA